MRVWMVIARGERTQAAVAKAAGMGQSHYCLIENGKRRPSRQAAQRLGAALQIDWHRFFEEGKRDGMD